jgi:hypothetical protein
MAVDDSSAAADMLLTHSNPQTGGSDCLVECGANAHQTPGTSDALQLQSAVGGGASAHQTQQSSTGMNVQRLRGDGLRFDPEQVAAIQTQIARAFTWDAGAIDFGKSDLSHPESNVLPFMRADVSGHTVWLRPPAPAIEKMLRHYMLCKSHDPLHTAACIVVPSWGEDHNQKWRKLLRGMVLLQQYQPGHKLFKPTAADADLQSVPWTVEVWYDPPLPPPPEPRPSSTPLARISATKALGVSMVFAAKISGRREHTLMDTGASHNFIAASFAEMMGLQHKIAGSSPSQVEVAGQTTLPILGSVKVPLRIGALSDTVTALVIPDLIRGVALILGESWMIHRKADILYSSMKCTLTSPSGQRLTLKPCGLQSTDSNTPDAEPLDGTDDIADLAAVCASVNMQATDTSMFISAREAETALRRGERAMMLLVRQAPDTPLDSGARLATLQSLAPEIGLMSPQQLDHLLEKWHHVLQEPPADAELQDRDVGRIIELETGKIPYRPPRRLSPAEYEVVQNTVADLLKRGWIAPSKSPYGSPIMFVAKKGGGLRCVQDLRMINKHTIKMRFPMPNIAELIDRLRDATVFSSIDLFSGYYQIKLHPDDCPKTAFSTPLGHYEFKVLAQGLVNAPAQFQSIMTKIFAPYINKFVVIYLDDILVFSKTAEEHAQHLDTVLGVLAEHKFYARQEKCHWNQPQVKYLGHVVGRNMVAMDPDKVSVIKEWPHPTTQSELRSFLGLANFFRKHVQGYATLTACLHELTKPSVQFQWTEAHATAFEHLK